MRLSQVVGGLLLTALVVVCAGSLMLASVAIGKVLIMLLVLSVSGFVVLYELTRKPAYAPLPERVETVREFLRAGEFELVDICRDEDNEQLSFKVKRSDGKESWWRVEKCGGASIFRRCGSSERVDVNVPFFLLLHRLRELTKSERIEDVFYPTEDVARA